MNNILAETPSERFRRLVPSVLHEYRGQYSLFFFQVLGLAPVTLRCEHHCIEYPSGASCPACDGEMVRVLDEILDGEIEKCGYSVPELVSMLNSPPLPVKTLSEPSMPLLARLFRLLRSVGEWFLCV